MTWAAKTSFIACNFPNHTQEVAVNRTELIESVVATTGLEKKQAEAAVAAFVDSVIAETKAGNKVSIFGFGIFTPKSRAARTGRNPQTGAPVKIAASKSVGFQPAAAYKTTLNTRGGAKKAAAKKAAPAVKAVATKKATPAKKTAAPAKKAPAKAATKTTKKR
ncbi:HU family DNA-binding protein [Acidiferrimicrobium sp. IK]|uniref:HU family DNA-binding protein n=1 Tax=Acidiferrimicrobium sp. IK TaxID=2871700 RepID=UPI003967A5CC